MKLSLTIIAVALLTSCVTIPIPPTGQNQGKLGSVQIKVAVSYTPYNDPNKPKQQKEKVDPNIAHAWEHFSKTLKDKR